jgi:ABC-type multidrug transport system fused ATPase/permease subunit
VNGQNTGKSTLAKVLLRILDFDKGSLNVNGVDIRSLNPSDYHKHTSAVFQGFSKFNSTVKENVGLGNVVKIGYRPAITQAVHLAEADGLVGSLPKGLKTVLETPGFDSISYPGMMAFNHQQRQGLSGGEVSFYVGFLALFFLLRLMQCDAHAPTVAKNCDCTRIHESDRAGGRPLSVR